MKFCFCRISKLSLIISNSYQCLFCVDIRLIHPVLRKINFQEKIIHETENYFSILIFTNNKNIMTRLTFFAIKNHPFDLPSTHLLTHYFIYTPTIFLSTHSLRTFFFHSFVHIRISSILFIYFTSIPSFIHSITHSSNHNLTTHPSIVFTSLSQLFDLMRPLSIHLSSQSPTPFFF